MPPRTDFRETHVKKRRARSEDLDVVYEADVERTRLTGDDHNPDWVTEAESTRAKAACGCLIGDDVKPRFHRDGTMVCTNHFFFCNVCSQELLPLDLVIAEKRIYCKACGEKVIDEMLWMDYRHPGSIDRTLLAHLKQQKRELRSRRWSAAWNRLCGRPATPRRRLLGPQRGFDHEE